MRKIIKKLKIVNIDLLVYTRGYIDDEASIAVKFELDRASIQEVPGKDTSAYDLYIDGVFAHRSNVFTNVHVLRLIKKNKQPAIGDCFTESSFRGMSIYPYMLNYITNRLLKNCSEVVILVAPSNLASIKGIEKASFKKCYRIQTKRFGPFYFNKTITPYI